MYSVSSKYVNVNNHYAGGLKWQKFETAATITLDIIDMDTFTDTGGVFLSFLLFSMCKSIQVAVNTWLNCSFFTLYHKMLDGFNKAICEQLRICGGQPEFNLKVTRSFVCPPARLPYYFTSLPTSALFRTLMKTYLFFRTFWHWQHASQWLCNVILKRSVLAPCIFFCMMMMMMMVR